MTEQFFHQPPFGVETIKSILPHRYPFLLVDRVLTLGHRDMTGYKNISVGEPVFEGHFPGHAVYPGVLQIESLAQLGAVWVLNQPENAGRIVYLMSVTNVKFRRPVVPGDRLDIEGTVLTYRGSSGKLGGILRVDDKVVSEATITFSVAKTEPAKSAVKATP